MFSRRAYVDQSLRALEVQSYADTHPSYVCALVSCGSPSPLSIARSNCRSTQAAAQDEDIRADAVPQASTSAVMRTPAIAQTPLISGADRARFAAEDQAHAKGGAGPKHRSNDSIKTVDKAHAEQSSWTNRLSLDWTRRDGSRSGPGSFLPLGLFSSFTQDGSAQNGAGGRYEPVAPMQARSKRQKSFVELDMDDFADGLRLSAAADGDDEVDQQRYYALREREEKRKRRRRKPSGGIGAFVRSGSARPATLYEAGLADRLSLACSSTSSTRRLSRGAAGLSNASPSS